MLDAGEPQLHVSPVGASQQLEPQAVGLRQAAVHAGQARPGTGPRRWGRGAGARAPHLQLAQVRVLPERNGHGGTAGRQTASLS